MNILITGCYGQLGTEMGKIAANRSDHQWFFTDIDRLDICNPDALEAMFSEHQINVCLNCAAYTAVDMAEDQPEKASLINADAPQVLAETCLRHHATLLHVSTDYVFAGDAQSPYKEDDPIAPQSVYGQTKADGERRIRESGCSHLIVRTAWLYSSTGKNFVKTMLKLAETHESVNVVSDQQGTPTWAGDLAQALMKLLDHYGTRHVQETFHFTNEGITTWDRFADAVFQIAGCPCQVNPITTAQYPTKASRPAYSVLDKTKIKDTLGIEIPFWEDSLRKCIEELNNKQ